MKQLLLLLFIVIIFDSSFAQRSLEIGSLEKGGTTTKTTEHQRILGTSLYVIIPDDFVLEDQVIHLRSDRQKSKAFGSYIQMFDRYHTYLVNNKILLKSKEAENPIQNFETTWNDHKAWYLEWQVEERNEHNINLTLDIDGKAFVIMARSEIDQPIQRDKLLEIIKTMYYDTSYVQDPLEIANFTFDNNITGFKFIKSFLGNYKYTQDGLIDDVNSFTNSIDFRELKYTRIVGKEVFTKPLSIEEAESYCKSYIERVYKNTNRYNISQISISRIGVYEAVSFESEWEVDSVSRKAYHCILKGEHRSLEFTAYAHDHFEEFDRKFRETLESVVIY